jgi:hypothetical protein
MPAVVLAQDFVRMVRRFNGANHHHIPCRLFIHAILPGRSMAEVTGGMGVLTRAA